jgi:dTDP-4-amino-4,6-dideoxygalactose transaminase
LIKYLKENDINAVFHYVPLHSALAGKTFGKFEGIDEFTTIESERLVRLPLYYGLEKEKVEYIIQKIKNFYE